jgi:hypothetical protein
VLCINCPGCWCPACARRAVQMFGDTLFDFGCPRCLRLCCCDPFSYNLMAASALPAALLRSCMDGDAKGGKAARSKQVDPSHDDGMPEVGSVFCCLPLHCRNCRYRPGTSAVGLDPGDVGLNGGGGGGSSVGVGDKGKRRGTRVKDVDSLPLEPGEVAISLSGTSLVFQYRMSMAAAAEVVGDILSGGDRREMRLLSQSSDPVAALARPGVAESGRGGPAAGQSAAATGAHHAKPGGGAWVGAPAHAPPPDVGAGVEAADAVAPPVGGGDPADAGGLARAGGKRGRVPDAVVGEGQEYAGAAGLQPPGKRARVSGAGHEGASGDDTSADAPAATSAQGGKGRLAGRRK